MIEITDKSGYIVDGPTRRAYDRICDAPGCNSSATRIESAEAFLRLVERYAAKGVRLIHE